MQRTEKYENLPVDLSPDELDQLKDDLAGTCTELFDSQAEFNEVTEGYKTELAGLNARIQNLTKIINRGFNIHSIRCYEEFDVPRGKVYLIREDTKQKVSERNISDQEKADALLNSDE